MTHRQIAHTVLLSICFAAALMFAALSTHDPSNSVWYLLLVFITSIPAAACLIELLAKHPPPINIQVTAEHIEKAKPHSLSGFSPTQIIADEIERQSAASPALKQKASDSTQSYGCHLMGSTPLNMTAYDPAQGHSHTIHVGQVHIDTGHRHSCTTNPVALAIHSHFREGLVYVQATEISIYLEPDCPPHGLRQPLVIMPPTQDTVQFLAQWDLIGTADPFNFEIRVPKGWAV